MRVEIKFASLRWDYTNGAKLFTKSRSLRDISCILVSWKNSRIRSKAALDSTELWRFGEFWLLVSLQKCKQKQRGQGDSFDILSSNIKKVKRWTFRHFFLSLKNIVKLTEHKIWFQIFFNPVVDYFLVWVELY